MQVWRRPIRAASCSALCGGSRPSKCHAASVLAYGVTSGIAPTSSLHQSPAMTHVRYASTSTLAQTKVVPFTMTAGYNELVEELLLSIPSAPVCIRASSLYLLFLYAEGKRSRCSNSTQELRRGFIRRQHHSMQHLLLRIASEAESHHWGMFISTDWRLVTKARDSSEAQAAFARHYTPILGADAHADPEKEEDEMGLEYFVPADMAAQLWMLSTTPPDFRRQQLHFMERTEARPAPESEPICEFYNPSFCVDDATAPHHAQEATTGTSAETDVRQEHFDPPPLPDDAASVVPRDARNSFSPSMLVPYVPTFFIPVERLLEQLPQGYTVDHLAEVFLCHTKTAAVELVTLEGRSYIRLHGGVKRNVALNCDAAHELYCEAYQPDPFLAEVFVHLLRSIHRFHRRGTLAPEWISLQDVISRAPPHILAGLGPFQQYQSLIFFAQMQHVFDFTPENGGRIALAAQRSLRIDTSPTPKAVTELLTALEEQKRLYVRQLETDTGRYFSDQSKRAILMYYGTIRRFLELHGAYFELHEEREGGLLDDAPRDRNVPPTTSHSTSSGFGAPTFANIHTSSLFITRASLHPKTTRTLEQKLEQAISVNDRRRMRKYRRRLSIQADPNNPYADPEVLLDAIIRYLPQRRHFSVKYLLNSLPPRMTDFLPEVPVELFRSGHPHKLQLFEYKYRNYLCVMRPGLPLPDGCLRTSYTNEELLFIITSEMLRCGGAELTMGSPQLFGQLPFVAKETLRRKPSTLGKFLTNYPNRFVLMFSGDSRNEREALVRMISRPAATQPGAMLLKDEEWGASCASPTEKEVEELEKEFSHSMLDVEESQVNVA